MADWMITCGNCGSADSSLRRCGRCFKVYYCSNKCQAQDWPRHKDTCSKQGRSDGGGRGSSREPTGKHAGSGTSGNPGGVGKMTDSNADFVSAGKPAEIDIRHHEHKAGRRVLEKVKDGDTVHVTAEQKTVNTDFEKAKSSFDAAMPTDKDNLHADIASNATTSVNTKEHTSKITGDSKVRPEEVALAEVALLDGDKVSNVQLTREELPDNEGDVPGAEKETKPTGRPCSPQSSSGKHARGKRLDNKTMANCNKSEEQDNKLDAKGATTRPESTLDDMESLKGSNGAAASEDTGTSGNCGACAKAGCTLRCAKCKDMFYCSRECQRRDWKQHKKACKKTCGRATIKDKDEKGKKYSETTPTSASGAQERPRLPQPEQEDPLEAFRRTFMMMQMGILPPEITDVETARPPGSLERAKLFAKTNLSMMWTLGLTVVDDLDDVPWECPFPFLMVRRPNIGLVAFIFKFHPYARRHAVYIKDKNDAVTKVEFYLDFDNPMGFFSFADLRPGNYLCLENPFMHRFMDGTVGIRVDDPSEVSIIPIHRLV